MACQLEAEDRERAIAAARGRAVGISLPVCVDCGEPIPFERQRAIPGTTRCIDCQTRIETLQRIAPP